MENSFEEIYAFLSRKGTPVGDLKTTGGVPFYLEAREVKVKKPRDDKRAIISRSGKSTRIYVFKEDWSNKLNSSGTRINHYTVPTDEWYSRIPHNMRLV